ncbi:MAG: hypothetical protein QXF05_02485 [Thermofilaceae archaeon]
MRDLYILAFPVRLDVEELYIIDPSGRSILEVRHDLNKKGIPNTVVRDGIVAATDNPSILEELRLNFKPLLRKDLRKEKEITLDQFLVETGTQIEIQESPVVKARLASSALGIYFRKKGFQKAHIKFFDPNDAEQLNGQYKIYAHNAFIAQVHYLPGTKTSYALALDPCVKLEIRLPLSELSLSEINNIDNVKVRGLSPSMFKLLEVIDEPSADQREIAAKTLEALRRFNPNLSVQYAGDRIAKVVPYSYQLLEYFKKANLMKFEPDSRQAFVYLYCTTLYPVASLDTLKALKVDIDSKKLRFWMRPSERYEKAVNYYVRKILLGNENGKTVKIGSIRISIREEIVNINNQHNISYRVLAKKVRKDSDQHVRLTDIPRKDLWIEKVLPIEIGLSPKVAVACTNTEAIEALELLKKNLEHFLSCITKGKVEVTPLSKGRSSQPIFDSVKDVINLAKRSGFNAIVLVGRGDEEEYAWFEYELSSIDDRIIVPQYIDGRKIVTKSKEGDAGGSYSTEEHIYNASYTVAKSILPKLGWRYIKLCVPEALNEAVIVGIDKTHVTVGKGTGLAIAAVLQSADGLRMDHLPPLLVENEKDAVLQVAKMVKGKKENYNGPVIFCVNRCYVQTDIYTELRNLFGEQLIVVSASKTHSMSRLLEKERNTFVNPGLGSCAVLEEDERHGRYLVASTFINRDRTIRPVLVEILNAGVNINVREVLGYIFSTQALCIETPYYVASMPWPLHRADSLCKKISKITKHVRALPSNPEVL